MRRIVLKIGNPRKATKEKGEKYFKAVTEKIATFMEDVAKTKREDFYN